MALPVRRRTSQATPVTRWDPFREFEELQAATGQLLEDLMTGPGAGNGGLFTPPVDIEETEDAWIVEADLPGVDKQRERKGILRRRTRPVGHFEFRVSLPGGADPSQVDANVNNGVLTVRIPKPEQSRPRRIEVTSQ
jgi:HSP20 family protein